MVMQNVSEQNRVHFQVMPSTSTAFIGGNSGFLFAVLPAVDFARKITAGRVAPVGPSRHLN